MVVIELVDDGKLPGISIHGQAAQDLLTERTTDEPIEAIFMVARRRGTHIRGQLVCGAPRDDVDDAKPVVVPFLQVRLADCDAPCLLGFSELMGHPLALFGHLKRHGVFSKSIG